MKLYDMAHCRTGDKGNTSNIAVIAYTKEDYHLLEKHLTTERVKDYFSHIVTGEVERYLVPQLNAINFVLTGALGGGVTCSLSLDAHGKSLGSILLSMEIID